MPSRPSARLAIRLTPRASRDEIVGFEANARGSEVLRVRVTAPALEGRANAALIALLAKRLGVPRGALHIISGENARTKVVEVEGLNQSEARARLEP